MSEQIEPALKAESWKHIAGRVVNVSVSAQGVHFQGERFGTKPGAPCVTVLPDELPSMIALANAALSESDPRKITREVVNMLRAVVEDSQDAVNQNERWGVPTEAIEPLSRLADALASYLPPE